MTEPVMERERWQAERQDAERELALKERDIALKEREATRQTREAAWKNPLVIAILTAALAAGSNALVSFIGARQQHGLEKLKAEAARILEMIKTDDIEQAARNLAFLVDTGLVADPDVNRRLAAFLETRKPENSPALPAPVPTRTAFLTQAEKDQLLGGPTLLPSPGPVDQISLDDPWIRDNIVEVEIPQLLKIGEPPASDRIRFNKVAAPALKLAFEEIEKAGLLGDIITLDGAFVPRTVSGSLNRLSSHALGIAVDLNARWNPFGAEPAKEGEPGALQRVVPIFEKHGFAWGGNLSFRRDAMHFEFADRNALAGPR